MTKTILIVDDEESIRFTFKLLLQQAGYNAYAVGDAHQAIKILDREHVDMVITDVILLGPTGIELLGWIQERLDPPVVAIITGQPEVGAMERAASLGAYDYLSKPVVKKTLLNTVRNALAHKSSLGGKGKAATDEPADVSNGAAMPIADRLEELQKARTLFEREMLTKLEGPKVRHLEITFLSHYFDTSSLALAYVKGDSILYVNRKFTELTGYRVEDVQSVRATMRDFYEDPKDFEQVLKAMEESFREGAPSISDPFMRRFMGRHKTGTPLPLSSCAVVLPNKRILYTLVRATDTVNGA